MKKFFLPLLAILLPAVFISCENFLSSNTEFREKISEEVKISTASSVNVVVLPKAGTGEVSKSAIEAKVGVPFMVQFFADENAEFLRWTAFSEYDETKTMDDQLGTTVVQYKNADNTNETGASFVKVEVTILKDIGQVTLVPWCGARPRVTTTEPVNYSTNVVRTTPIKIRFSKAIDESCISTKENPEIYKNYFELYQRDTANSDEKFIDLSKYFDAPVIKNEKEIWFNCKEKTDESKWLKAGSVIRFVVKGSLKDADGVRFDDTTSIEFTLGAKGDGTGPIIAISEFKNGTNDIHQTVFGNWEPRSGAAAGVYYADTDCRVSGSGSFSMKVKADDSTTGDTGLMGFSVIQRLVYVPKGAYLPGTDDEKAASDMIPFDEGKTKWNYLSGILESDFKKETIFEYKSENTDFEKTFEIDEGFKTTSGKTVDGIYMFEITALDGNSNYASNPCYYYVVRDTTAPDGKENAAKVKFTDDCGVAVNGKRFFGRNYRTVKFRIDGKISDFGTQGLPWTACKSEECRWAVALSTSDTVCDSSTMVGDWSGWNKGSENIEIDIISEFLDQTIDNSQLYVWMKCEDNFKNISDIVLTGEILYLDCTKPNVTLNSDTCVLLNTLTGNVVYLSETNEKVHFTIAESSILSGVKSCKFGLSGSESDIDVSELLINGVHLNINEKYTVAIKDRLENETIISFETKLAGDDIGFVEFHSSEISKDFPAEMTDVYGVQVRGFETERIAAAAGYDSDSVESHGYVFDSSYMPKNVKLEYYIDQKNKDLAVLKNGIWLDDFVVTGFTIRKCIDGSNNVDYSDDGVILSSNNVVGFTPDKSYIPIEENTIFGKFYISITGYVTFIQSGENSISMFVSNGLVTKKCLSPQVEFDVSGPGNVSISKYYSFNATDCLIQKKSDTEFNIFTDSSSEIEMKMSGDDVLLASISNYSDWYRSRYDDSETSNTYVEQSFSGKSDSAVYIYDEEHNVKIMNVLGGYARFYIQLPVGETRKDYEIKFCDGYGNVTPVKINMMRKDTTPPTITYTNAFKKTSGSTTYYYLKPSETEFVLNFDDPESGYKCCYYASYEGSVWKWNFTEEKTLRIKTTGQYKFRVTNNSEKITEETVLLINDSTKPMLEAYKFVTQEVTVLDKSKASIPANNSNFDINKYTKTIRGIETTESGVPRITTDFPTEYVRSSSKGRYDSVPMSLWLSVKDGESGIKCVEFIYSEKNTIKTHVFEIEPGTPSVALAFEGFTSDYVRNEDGTNNGKLFFVKIRDMADNENVVEVAPPDTISKKPIVNDFYVDDVSKTKLEKSSSGIYYYRGGTANSYPVILDCSDECGKKIEYVILSNTRFTSEGNNICKISSLKTVPRQSTMWTYINIIDDYGNVTQLNLDSY